MIKCEECNIKNVYFIYENQYKLCRDCCYTYLDQLLYYTIDNELNEYIEENSELYDLIYDFIYDEQKEKLEKINYD